MSSYLIAIVERLPAFGALLPGIGCDALRRSWKKAEFDMMKFAGTSLAIAMLAAATLGSSAAVAAAPHASAAITSSSTAPKWMESKEDKYKAESEKKQTETRENNEKKKTADTNNNEKKKTEEMNNNEKKKDAR